MRGDFPQININWRVSEVYLEGKYFVDRLVGIQVLKYVEFIQNWYLWRSSFDYKFVLVMCQGGTHQCNLEPHLGSQVSKKEELRPVSW